MNNFEINYENISCENIYDFRNVFSGMDDVLIYYDSGHMSDFGNEIIAKNIAEKAITLINKN